MLSKNPFAKYAAHSKSQNNGWLETKKRGKDDKLIERDKRKAEKARKDARKKSKSKKRKPFLDETDDDNSLGSFIVNDDTVEIMSSDDDELLQDRKYKRTKIRKTIELLDDDFSSDSDLGEPAFTASNKAVRKKKSKKSLSSHKLIESKTAFENKYTNSLSKSTYMKDEKKDDRDLDDSFDDPYEKIAIQKALKNSLKENLKRKEANDHVAYQKAMKNSLKTKTKKRHITSDDSDSDSDLPMITKRTYYKIESESESESESENDNDDNEEVEEYEEANAKEVTSILETTKKLSTEILSRMSQWCIETKSSKSQKQNLETTGMIFDGAISLFTCNSEKHKLLVQKEELEQFCPSLKVADYQLLGINWMALLHGMQCSTNWKRQSKQNDKMHVNGVLADEMGLGKTVQTIAFLAWLKYSKTENQLRQKNNERSRPHIIIVPASVLSNWQNEFKKFCPDMTVVKYHGNLSQRSDIQKSLKKSLPSTQKPLPLDVVLTTFSYFSSEKCDDRNFLRKFQFDYMVVDEAHCLKDAKNARYKNMDRFSTSHRLLLTGTPVQNNPKELLSLLCFLMPLFSEPSSFNFDEENQNSGGAHMLNHLIATDSHDSEEKIYRKLKQLLSPFVLRRKKSDVLSQLLPPKERKLELVPFNKKSRQVYDSILTNHVASREKNIKSISIGAAKHIFTSLRKAANHPLLLRTRHMSTDSIEHLSNLLLQYGYFGRDASCTLKLVQNELEQFSDYDIHCAALDLIHEDPLRAKEMEKFTLQEDDLFSSPKFVRLKSLLPELISDGHRILIFSQWTKCLDLLGCLLDALEFKYLRLDGSTDISERQNLIDTFNNDEAIPIFLLSTRAGGMGINLTAADTCILHDLDFNPFNDLQAEDRCHRIGQKRPVTVIKMVTADTVDASIYSMQEKKAKMNAAILENNGNLKKKDENDAINSMVKDAMTKYLSSPTSKK